MAVGQSEARTDMALRLLYLEPRAERGRRRNKEEVIMDWTSLLMIETVVGFLGIFALHLFLERPTMRACFEGSRSVLETHELF